MKNLFNITLMAAALLAATSCSESEITTEPESNEGKFLIQFGQGTTSLPETRMGLHKTASTKMPLQIVSDYISGTTTDGDAKHNAGKDQLISTTLATAAADGTYDASSVSGVTTSGTNARYWDDLHGRNSHLSVYSIAVPGKDADHLANKLELDVETNTNNTQWTTYNTAATTIPDHKVIWSVSTSPSLTTIEDEDLVYSRNLRLVAADNTETTEVDETNDQRLKFDNNAFETASGAKALEFNHALSRMTIKIQKGAGFDSYNATVFNVQSVSLIGFNTKGTLDVSAGTYSNYTSENIECGGTYTEADAYPYSYVAMMFPETTLHDVLTTVLNIKVTGNEYHISGKQIADAIRNNTTNGKSDFEALEPGYHYIISLTIGKKQIESITAKLVDWHDIYGTVSNVTNARINLNLEDTEGSILNHDFAFYRAAQSIGSEYNDEFAGWNWKTGYNEKNSITYVAPTEPETVGKYTLGTTWYWENNLTYYHFRAVSPDNTTVNVDSNDGDYFDMTGDAISSTPDYVWGAPLKSSESSPEYSYDTYVEEQIVPGTGYCNNATAANGQIYKAIGPTSDVIKLTMFHMMSKVQVNLVTPVATENTNTVADNGVDLSDAAVSLTYIDNSAKVRMGNGYIKTSGTLTESIAMTDLDTQFAENEDSKVKESFTYCAIPQSMTNNSTDKHVGLTITAKNNQYFVDLSKAKTVDPTTPTNASIERWLPNHSYIYNITLTKTGIKDIEAKLVDWTTVNGTISTPITLETH